MGLGVRVIATSFLEWGQLQSYEAVGSHHMQSENEAGSVITILSMISLFNLSPALLLANSFKTVPLL